MIRTCQAKAASYLGSGRGRAIPLFSVEGQTMVPFYCFPCGASCQNASRKLTIRVSLVQGLVVHDMPRFFERFWRRFLQGRRSVGLNSGCLQTADGLRRTQPERDTVATHAGRRRAPRMGARLVRELFLTRNDIPRHRAGWLALCSENRWLDRGCAARGGSGPVRTRRSPKSGFCCRAVLNQRSAWGKSPDC